MPSQPRNSTVKRKDINEIVERSVWNAHVINGNIHLIYYQPDGYNFNLETWKRVSTSHTLARRAAKANRLARHAGYLAYMGGQG